jgi:hypothetical protein
MKNKKHFNTAVCFIVGIVILSTAAFANYGNANGYTAYKEALKNIIYLDNYTLKLDVSLYDNDTRVVTADASVKYDENGEVMQHMKASISSEYDSLSTDETSETWLAVDNDPLTNATGKYVSYSSYGNNTWNIGRSSYNQYSSFITDFRGDDRVASVMNFGEKLVDLFVGDLKNNFVYTGGEDGNKDYQIILGKQQIPEIITAGISLVYSMSKSEYHPSVIYNFSSETVYDDPENNTYSKAYDLVAENGGEGVAVIRGNDDIAYYGSMEEYYLSDDFEYDPTDLNDFFTTMSQEPVIESVECYVTLDENGYIVSNSVSGSLRVTNIFGETKIFKLSVSLSMEDIGTTKIDMPVIPENATVYDYRNSTYENGYSYTITKNGIVSESSNNKDNFVRSREWFLSISPEERVRFVSDILGFDAEDSAELDSLMTKLTLIYAAGEYDSSYKYEFGLEFIDFLTQLKSDLSEIYGFDLDVSFFTAEGTSENAPVPADMPTV